MILDILSFYCRRAIETFFFNAEGKVFKALATYNA